MHYRDEEVGESKDVQVRVWQQPNCVEAVIASCNEKIKVLIEREFLVEVIGDTKVCIQIHPLDFEEEWTFEESSSSSSSSSSSISSSSPIIDSSSFN